MWIEAAGWIGMVVLLISYGLASAGKLSGTHYMYHILNFFGGLGILINAMSRGVKAQVGIEVAWMTIAVVGIVAIVRTVRGANELD